MLKLFSLRLVVMAMLFLHCLTLPACAEDAPLQNGAPVNDVTRIATSQGVAACASRVNQVSSFLGAASSSGAILMIPKSEQDQRLFPLSMEIPTNTGSAYVSATFAPNQANGCGAAYDAVVYWPQICPVVASMQFGSIKKITQLGKYITVLDGGATTKVFLMPAGAGCVSIKKEVVM